MQKVIDIGSSSANPPHLGHKSLLNTIINSEIFDEVLWKLNKVIINNKVVNKKGRIKE